MLILASASPRRQELLRNAGIAFETQPADIDETPHEGEAPVMLAERMAREKALAIFRIRPHDCVLGADTIVVVDESILGKPRDAADAARMLRQLSGRTHRVITGVCLVGAVAVSQSGIAAKAPVSEKPRTENREPGTALPEIRSATTLVTMCRLSERDILSYVATGEPMDKAGAYAIQGMASRWIPQIEGEYSNVVGLPVALVCGMLREHGLI
jgi:septum formation protein